MRFVRQHKHLNDAIEHLNGKLVAAKGDPLVAWSMLDASELRFVREELESCIQSRTYYLQNYHIVQPEKGDPTLLYPLWDHQWMVENEIDRERKKQGWSRVIVLKPRQAGITEYSTGCMVHATFFTPHAYSLTVAQNPKVASHVFRKINFAYDYLPWWMRPERQYHEKGEMLEFQRKDEATRAVSPGLASVFVTAHSQILTGVAIGRTIRNLHGTEVSRWASGEIFTADIEPSMNAPDTFGIFESTANGRVGFFYELWKMAMDGESEWTGVFLPAYRAKKYSLPRWPQRLPNWQTFPLTEKEKAIQAKVKKEENFDVTPEFFNWRRARIKFSVRVNGSPYSHMESYPISPDEAFQSSGSGAFPRHKLDDQAQLHVRNPLMHGEIFFKGIGRMPELALDAVNPAEALKKRERENRLWIWEEPQAGEVYYCACDTALGNEGDFSAAQVFRAGKVNNPDVQVAEWVGWESPVAYAKVAYALGMFYNRCEIAVEYQSEGMTTANYLMNDLEYPNLYRPRQRDRVGAKTSSLVHWQTTSKTKPLIVSEMCESMLSNTVVIRSKYLLEEMRDFIKDENRYVGLDNHDDSCMAAMICLFCMHEAMPEMRGLRLSGDDYDSTQTQDAIRSARVGMNPSTWGIYDDLNRFRMTASDQKSAEKILEKFPGWHARPVLATRANTSWSPIYHSKGPENDLVENYGVDPFDANPYLVNLYRSAQDVDRFNEYVSGGDIWMDRD